MQVIQLSGIPASRKGKPRELSIAPQAGAAGPRP